MKPLAILGLGPGEIILLLLVVLIVFGASKLPNIGSSLGKGMRNFKKGIKGEEEDQENEENEGKEDSSPKNKPLH